MKPLVLVPEPLPARKPLRLNKWHAITVFLVVVIAVQGYVILSLNPRYDALDARYKSLTSEHQSLTSDYDTLQGSYSSLQSTHDSYVSSYDYLRDLVNKRTLASVVKDFITPNEATVRSRVIQITGGWGNPSDWNEFWTDVKSMYDWVVNNIEYRYDCLSPVLPSTPSGNVEYREDMWQFPKETLNLTRGDCEDMAILLTSMILSYGGAEFGGAECILIESSDTAHVGVQMLVEGDLITILDPAGKYYTRDSVWTSNLDQKDISTEINNWLNYWKPEMGNDVHVDRVFSDSLDRSFSSTSEYTTWMYSR